MKKTKIIVLMCCIILLSSFNQSSVELDKETKMLVFMSVEFDGSYVSKTTLKDYFNVLGNHFNHFKIEYTTKKVFYNPIFNVSDSIMSEYQLQLFKIPDDNFYKQSRYLIWYKDFHSEVWLRAGGFVENDLNLLFDYLRGQKKKKRMLQSMIEEWTESNSLFQEAKLNCIYKGYVDGNTKSDCFKSVYYIKANAVCIGFNPLNEKELNSIFSRIPLYGNFFEFQRTNE
jgi:hypothetical protein